MADLHRNMFLATHPKPLHKDERKSPRYAKRQEVCTVTYEWRGIASKWTIGAEKL